MTSLMVLDVLPPQCSLEIDVFSDDSFVRFRAVRGEEKSYWSRPYPKKDCPIQLSWDEFEFPH